jgi:hypothetical protein
MLGRLLFLKRVVVDDVLVGLPKADKTGILLAAELGPAIARGPLQILELHPKHALFLPELGGRFPEASALLIAEMGGLPLHRTETLDENIELLLNALNVRFFIGTRTDIGKNKGGDEEKREDERCSTSHRSDHTTFGSFCQRRYR